MGRCYLPEEQIMHGGMKYDYGDELPFYNPGMRCVYCLCL